MKKNTTWIVLHCKIPADWYRALQGLASSVEGTVNAQAKIALRRYLLAEHKIPEVKQNEFVFSRGK